MARFPPPQPPRPGEGRRPPASFGWLDARLLHEGWLARLGAEGGAVLVLLSLAADPRGVSFYGRDRMAERLGLTRPQADEGLRRLLALDLVAHRPWRPGARDGVWQLLALPPPPPASSRASPPAGPNSIARILAGLGFASPIRATPPESRGS